MVISIAAVTEYKEDTTQVYFCSRIKNLSSVVLNVKKKNARPAEKQYMEPAQHNKGMYIFFETL